MDNPAPATPRIRSIDWLRGWIIFLMIYFNTGVPGTPWWLEHFPADQNGMTIVDVIFPAFLFIMGAAIPFSVGRQLDNGVAWQVVFRGMVFRSVSLILMGLLDVGLNKPDIHAMGGTLPFWGAMVFLSYFLVWHSWADQGKRVRMVSFAMRIVGGVFLVWYLVIFKRAGGGWMQPGYWGILGVLGWSYFIVGSLYFLVRKHRDMQILLAFVLLGYHIFIKEAGLPGAHWLNSTASLWGGRPSIVMFGVAMGSMLREPLDHGIRLRWAGMLAAAAVLLAVLLEPLYGIGKVRSTPTWIFASIAITLLGWMIAYWTIDLKSRNGPLTSRFVGFGTVPLTIYILHPMLMNLLQLAKLDGIFHAIGSVNYPVGAIRNLVLTSGVCFLAVYLNRRFKFTLKV